MSNLNSLFATTQQSIQACKKLLGTLEADQLDDSYVVAVQDICLGFTLQDGKPSNPRTCGAANATVFTLDEAQRIAAAVGNGNNARGKPVALRQALTSALAAHTEVLAMLTLHRDKGGL